MKKLQFLIMVFMTLLLCWGCKKDSVGKKGGLEGTKWTIRASSNNYETLHFINDEDMTVSGKTDGERYSYDGDYDFDSPDEVTMTFYDDGERIEAEGEIDGDVMSVTIFYDGVEYEEVEYIKE